MDLFRSRSALHNRLAPPLEGDVSKLAERLVALTEEIEDAPDEHHKATRLAERGQGWRLLSILRLRGAADQKLPELSIAAVQEVLAAKEAVISWMWVGRGVLIVMAIDKSRIHAERIVLTDEQSALLDEYLDAARLGEMHGNALAPLIEELTDALLPRGMRDFIADATHLILVPHRSLHLVPFHAATVAGRYLIQRAAVRYAPNLGSLLVPWQGVHDGTVLSVGIGAFKDKTIGRLPNAEAEARDVALIWAARGVRPSL